MWQGIINKYKEYLPVTKNTPIITLYEGNTPLIEVKNLNKKIKNKIKIFVKYEGTNPTGSFKDRGMTLAISKAREEGSKGVMCASTGNTSASAAAYASLAQIKCVVLIPHGNVTLGKLVQALIHGAKIIEIQGNFDDALKLVKEITNKYPLTLVNSLNPFRIEGQKTGSFEICDVLNFAPDFHLIPVGNAGNITAYWKGYKEYKERGKIKKTPEMLGFQAQGAAPIIKGKPIKNPQTIATAIKIGNPASWQQAVKAIKESYGLITTVTDSEIISAYKILAELEGIFVEPASAASVAGLIKLSKGGYFNKYSKRKALTAVCVLTGHGLKDPEMVLKSIKPPIILPPKIDTIIKTIGI